MHEREDGRSAIDQPVDHPSSETWVAYIYNEVPRSKRKELDTHLEQCAVCNRTVGGWRRTLPALDEYGVPARPAAKLHKTQWPVFPTIKWAAAALVLIGIGLGFGRFTAPAAVDVAALKNELRAELLQAAADQSQKDTTIMMEAAQEHSRRLLVEYAEQDQARRVAEDEQLLARWRQMDNERATEILALRRDLETVAVVTDASLRKAEQQLVSLTQAAPAVNQP